MSSAPSTAAHTAWPMRPAAPETATVITPRAGATRPRGRSGRRPRRTPRRRRPALRQPELPRQPVHVVERDRVEGGQHLVQGEQRHAHQHRAAEPVHPREVDSIDSTVRPFTLSRARSSSSSVTPSSTSRRSSYADHVDRLAHVVRPRAHVHRHLAGVLVLARVRVHRVRQPALLAHLLEEPRRGRAAEDRVEHPQREAAVVAPRHARAPRHRWYCSVSFLWKLSTWPLRSGEPGISTGTPLASPKARSASSTIARAPRSRPPRARCSRACSGRRATPRSPAPAPTTPRRRGR